MEKSGYHLLQRTPLRRLVAIGKANNFAPTDLSLVIMAGKVYGYLNKFGEALNTFESLIQAKPDFWKRILEKRGFL